jgi:hypothetical protein
LYLKKYQSRRFLLRKRQLELVMKKLVAARRSWLLFAVVFFLTGIDPCFLRAQTASPELVVDICSTPHKYWNKYVMIKGHIRSVTANPPGTNRGSYVLRDSSDADITVLTTDLPSQGKEYTVSGNVEQTSPDSKVPVIREFRRVLGSEAPQPPAVRPRRALPREEVEPEPEPVRRREAAPPPVQLPPVQPAPTPAAPKEVAPIIVQTAPPAESGLSTTAILGLVGLAALIIIAVVVVIMRPKRTPAPAPYAPPMPTATPSHIRPPAPPPPTSGRTVNAAAAPRASAATQVVPPPAAKATEVFFDLGMELVITDGPDKGKRFPLTKTAITLGRSGSRQNDVTLSDGTVSREHAKIIYAAAEKTFRLINESTTNPARLNGNPIDAVAIKDGDTIQIGSTIMKFSKKG